MPVADRDLTVTNLMDCVVVHIVKDMVMLIQFICWKSVTFLLLSGPQQRSLSFEHHLVEHDEKRLKVKVNMLNNQALNTKSTPHFKRLSINSEQVIPK